MIIHTIGGYNEVGKNMTAVELKDDVIIFDAGFYLPPIVELEEQEREGLMNEKRLRNLGAIPDDTILDKMGLRQKVRAILIGHAHLDHVGAVPYIAGRYNASVLATPFTLQVLKTIMKDEDVQLKNKLKEVQPNSSVTIKGKKYYKADFLNITHSTIQTSLMALHTPEGVVLYANDFKLDNAPQLGKKPNYESIRKIAKEGVKALIVESLYASEERKTPSEKVARSLLEDVLLGVDNNKAGIIVTTFSSHIARLKSIVDLGKKLNRNIVFVGRSLNKYVSAAIQTNLCPFKKKINVWSYRKQMESGLKKVNKNKDQYLVVCTGHQGEPGSVLDRIAKDQLPLKLSARDHVIFSSSTIPVEINIANKSHLEKRIKNKGARIFNNVHVSVLPNTEVVFNGDDGMKIKEIGKIDENEKKALKVPAFDSDFKIKWFDANLIEHDYNGKIFDIHTKSGRRVSITSGHSLFKLDKGKIISEIGDNLQEGDYLAIPKKFSWHRQLDEINIENYLDLSSKHFHKENGYLFFDNISICPLKIKLTKEFAKLLGYYLAEGSAPRHISLVIGKHEKDILEEIKESINKILPSNIHVYERGNSYEIHFGARTLKTIFKKWFGDNAKTKKIPDFVFSSSNEFKINFLGAYINGDGCIDKGEKHFRIRIKTSSKKLASDLLYLFSQINICAKFDHVEKNQRRKIANSQKFTEETVSYVLRIQGANSLTILKDFLVEKFKIKIENHLKDRRCLLQQLPPESFPVEKLNLKEIEPKKTTYLYDIKNYNERCKKKKKHISPELIKNQAVNVTGFTNKIINSDLLFDPIVRIETSDYEGKVYDFEVPGAENFIGGFGGIMLHNSGHAGREDLRDFINMVQPEHIIPAHGDLNKLSALAELASELGYKLGKNCHISQNLQKLKI